MKISTRKEIFIIMKVSILILIQKSLSCFKDVLSIFNKKMGFTIVDTPSYIFKYSVHHWIQDINGVYVYNPEPTDGETVVWNGDSIKVSKEHNGDTVTFKFASGSGVLTWRKYGKIIQVDTGRFVMGRHDGQFKHHFFPSGRIEYSNWCCGIEID